MAKVSEKIETKEVTDIEILTNTVATLAAAVKTQNDILLCLLHKFDVEKDLPFWITKEGVEEEVGPKVKACVEAIRKVYGPSETDKN